MHAAPSSGTMSCCPLKSTRWAIGLLIGITTPLVVAQQHPPSTVPVVELPGQPPLTARQSSDFRPDTTAEIALPVEFQNLALPSASTPAYTRVQPDPWWQMDLRVRRDIATVAVEACEGYVDNGANGPVYAHDTANESTRIACNSDYDLSGAWLLVSDLPFPNDPWGASVVADPAAVISRFPFVSNGYQQPQVATLHRAGRYLRIQFPPGVERALAIESLDIRGTADISDVPLALPTAFDHIFPETRALIDHLWAYQEAASLTEREFGRLQDRGETLERAAAKAQSIARRIDALDANLSTAINLLGKVEVISPIRTLSRTTERSLATLRSSVRALKAPARRAKEALERARRSLHAFNSDIGRFRLRLLESILWSAGEETAVGGLYQCQIADPKDPLRLIVQPLTEPLEGYAGFRNVQFERTGLNAHTRTLGSTAIAVNDGIGRSEAAAGDASRRLQALENELETIDAQLSSLLVPLRSIDSELGKKLCVPFTDICVSVDEILQAVQDAKDFFGLSILEDLAYGLLDPIISEITRPLQASLPRVPAFPAGVDVGLPDSAALLEALSQWDGIIDSLGDLLNTPSLHTCAESHGVVEEARTTDSLWQRLNDLAGDGI